MKLLASVVVCVVATSAACQRTPARVRMATTTSVENSGLLAAMLPAFERDSHITVEVLPVGSGQAMNLLKRGEVAVGLTHDPAAEAAALSAGVITGYRKIMFNDFVVVGPADDPAHVASASNAADAFAKIAASGAFFASRGDNSGTYTREQELWLLAKQRPESTRLLDTGQGMGGTLRIASERDAYTLSDRATFEQMRSSLRVAALYEGGTELLNTYAIFMRAGVQGVERTNAETLTRWFVDGEGRQHVAAFVTHGVHAFHVWPLDTSRTKPTDVPPVEIVNAR
ncbi:MAG TPA: substrate-binding domain-containing protein [Vicinamibacterales bacterium]|nr:substrate-binding domain-containing protein [Vicinamibacterales bacterium]